MTHNNFLSRLTHFVANGRVSTPPCNSHGFLRVFTDGEPTANRQRIDSECCRGLTDGRPTVEYAVQHTLRYAFLLLTFLLLTPSNMWGAENFSQGQTLYFDLNGLNWDVDRAVFGAIFYTSSDYNINGKDEGYWDDANISQRGSCYKIDDKSTRLTHVDGDIYSVVVPYGNAARVRIGRFGNTGDQSNPLVNGYLWGCTQQLYANAMGSNNCIKLLQAGQFLQNVEWSTYQTQGGGDEPTTKTFKGGEVFYMDRDMIATDGSSHDFLKYGRCDFNIYNPDNHDEFWGGLTGTLIPNTTIIKFVVTSNFTGKKWGWVKVKALENTSTKHETAKVAIPTDGKNYIKADGSTSTTLNWGTYTEALPWSSDTYQTWYLTGDFTKPGVFDGWDNPTSYTFTEVDAYHKQVTIKNLDPNNSQIFSNQNGHKLTRFEIVKGDWNDPRINKPHFDAAGSNCVLMEDWKSPYASSTRMVVELTQKSDITFDIWRSGTGDADRRVTITITPSTEPEPDPECAHPQSGTWLYLSGNTHLTGHSWQVNDTKLDWDCDEGVYYHTFSNLKKGDVLYKYRVKITNGTNWDGELNGDNIDNNHKGANLELSSVYNKEVGFCLNQDADVTIYTDGNKVWAYADMATPAAGDKTLYLNCKDFPGWPQHATTLAVWDGVEYRPFTKIPDCANDDLFVATGVHSASSYDFEFYNKSDNSSHKVSLNLGANNACRITDWDNGAAQTVTPNYTVHFYKNGHGSDIADRCVAAGSSTTDPQATATDGWVCKGWYTNDGLTDKFIFGTTTITAEITLYAKWEQVEMVTVQFATDGGQPVPDNQEIAKGTNATKPATDPVKAGYTFTGWDWNFDNTITENKTINAQWALKGVESVTLDKTELTMRVGGTTQKLTPTCAPEDVIGVSYSWAVTSGSAVSVSTTGLVSPLVKGQAVVTCTATNEAGISKTATCFITVKGEDEDCETIGVIYAEKQVSDMTQVDMFTESMNTEPKEYTKVQIKVGNAYAYVDVDPSDAKIKHGSGTTDYYYWYQIATGTQASCGRDMYLYKNVGNNKYLMKQKTGATNINWGWDYVITSDFITNDKRFEWYFKDSNDKRLVCNETTNSNNTKYSRYEMFLSRKDIESAPVGTYIVCGSSDGDQGGDELTTKIDNTSTVDNPNYLYPTVTVEETTYYRFANGAVVSTTLPKEMKAEDTIKVYYYATVATTAELRINGSTVDDIAASVGENIYKYVVKYADAGQTAVAVASNSTAFLMSEIKVSRPTPKDPITPVMNWNPAITGTITKQVSKEKFTYEAVATKGAGLITYSSNNTDVATVDATTGEVTMIAEGDAVITATMEQEGCYAEGSISYNLHLNDLPKPTITFTTLPADVPQGSVQNIVVTTTGGDNFKLAITKGTGATLKKGTCTDTRIEATLELGANATNIELTASTDRTATLAQNAMKATITVSACIPTGADIFEFTLTGSNAATDQVAGGIIGGTVDQTALGTKGTDDNPAMVDVITAKTLNADGKYIGYDGGVKVVEGTGDNTKWYMIPAGRKATTSWGAKSYDLYYLYNKDAKKYLYRNNDEYVDNGQWPYYTTDASADASNARATDNKYTWFVYDSGNGKLIICGDASNLDDSKPEYSYHLHTANQSVDVTNNHAPKPAVPCGRSTDINDYSKIDITTTQAANPVMIKSVEYNNKTYYIISSEGSITLHGDFKAGDVVNVDTYDRKTGEADIIEKTISEDATSYTYTTSNEYLCVNNIKVFRAQVGEMINPVLTWDNIQEGATVTLNGNIQETVTHTATTSTPQVLSTITYTSSDPSVATVNANGVVTAKKITTSDKEKTVTITATQAAIGCYNKATATYKIQVYNVVLQDLVNDAIGTLTLPCNFNDDVTINKQLTIDAQGHKIGNLTITTAGDLTIESAMTAKDFIIEADQAGHKSGQLKGADNLTLNGDAFVDITFAPEQVNTGWYAFTVPFQVSSTQGVYNVEKGDKGETVTQLVNEKGYAIMQYQGDVRAEGKYGWIKVQKKGGKLYAGQFYVITLGDTDYNTIRFMMTKGTNLAAATSMEIHEYASAESGNAGWNGVGNPNLYHATAAITGLDKMQTYNHDNDAFEVGILDESHVVGTPFFVQSDGDKTMTTSVAVEKANAPTRMLAAATAGDEFTIDLELDGKKQDRIFLSASEEASATYEIGHDLTKMTLGTAKVAQVAINGYGMSLCDAEFMLDADNEAVFPLTITAPKAGDYTLSIKRACENQSVFVMDGNQVVWDLTQGDYTLSLAKGTSSNYSLLLQAAERQMPTGNKQLKANGEGVQKIILHNALRIIKNGKMYNVLGL